MPTLGTTAPATLAGAFAVGDAEVISGAVLLQLAYPGTPVFHSIMQAWADPRNGNYVTLLGRQPDAATRPVEMAHHWGLPSLGACYGTDSPAAGTWQAAAEVVLDPVLAGLDLARDRHRDGPRPDLHPPLPGGAPPRRRHLPAGAPRADGPRRRRRDAGARRRRVRRAGRPLPGRGAHPEAHADRRSGAACPTSRPRRGGYRDPVEVAREQAAWIRENHHPEPLEAAQPAELARILAAARAGMG